MWLEPARVAPHRSLACQRRHSRASPPQAADDISRKQEALNVLERIEGKLVRGSRRSGYWLPRLGQGTRLRACWPPFDASLGPLGCAQDQLNTGRVEPAPNMLFGSLAQVRQDYKKARLLAGGGRCGGAQATESRFTKRGGAGNRCGND